MVSLEKHFQDCFAEANFDPSLSLTSFRLRINPRAMDWLKVTFKTFITEAKIKGPEDITISNIQNWINGQATNEQRWSEALLVTFLHALNTFLHWAKRKGLITAHQSRTTAIESFGPGAERTI